MANRMPPVPPEQRSPKGPGDQREPAKSGSAIQPAKAPDNPKEQGQQGNTYQNTHHQGHQQDR